MKICGILTAILASLVVAALGLAAVLDLVSLRALAAETDIERLRLAVEHARTLVSHRKAQGLELTVGLVGLGLFMVSVGLFAHRWQRPRRHVS